MTNFFDFQKDKLVVYFNDSSTKEFDFDLSNSFFKENVVDFIKSQISSGNPSVIYWYSNQFTLLPQSVFSSKFLDDYIKLNFGEIPNDLTYHFDILHTQQAVLVYTLPNWIKELKEKYFPIVPLKHHAGQLITRSRGEMNDFVSISVYKNDFTILILKNGKLQICNSFEYQTDVDLIYFFMLNFQKLELNSSTKVSINIFESAFTTEQFQESFSSFKEFEQLQLSWDNQLNFYKNILCV